MNLTAAEVQQGLQAFYASEFAGAMITPPTLLGSGFEADVFAFTLKSDLPAQDLILRLYVREGVVEKANREFVAMRRLNQAGYPVPRVHHVCTAAAPFTRPFLIMERIDGVSLGASYWGAPESQRLASETLLIQLMAALHALEGSVIFPEASPASSDSPFSFVDQEIATLSSRLQPYRGKEPVALRETLAWLASYRSTAPCERLSVVHGDFHPNNVLLRADGAPCVIDWSNVRLGDYRMDIAWSRLITQAEALPEGRESGLRLYERLTGKTITHLAYFDVLACARLLFGNLVSLPVGPAQSGLPPTGEEQTRKDPAHLRFGIALLQERTGIDTSELEEAVSVWADK